MWELLQFPIPLYLQHHFIRNQIQLRILNKLSQHDGITPKQYLSLYI